MMEKMRNRKKKKGFTLIELIVVIAILGILAAIAIPRFSGVQDDSKLRADKATARTIVSAIQIGEANGDYILSGTKIALASAPTGDITATIVAQLVTDEYLAATPVLKSGTNALTVAIVDGAISKITGGKTNTTELYPAP